MQVIQNRETLSRYIVEYAMTHNLTPEQLLAVHRIYHELQMLNCKEELRSDLHDKF